MYPFVNLFNVDHKELDKYVIGAWIENHKSEEMMKEEIMGKINKAVKKEIEETI